MFSVLTSKIFGGATVALALALVGVMISKNHEIRSQAKVIKEMEATLKLQRADLATLAANEITLKAAVNQCSDSVARTAQVAQVVARSGQAAVEQVRSAGERATARAISRLQAMPRDATDPADLCAQADAILQQGAR
jgi:predicted pyridoxine 5'-phosphate oxidase superfamily flavin-nucleotide-binding protein